MPSGAGMPAARVHGSVDRLAPGTEETGSAVTDNAKGEVRALGRTDCGEAARSIDGRKDGS